MWRVRLAIGLSIEALLDTTSGAGVTDSTGPSVDGVPVDELGVVTAGVGAEGAKVILSPSDPEELNDPEDEFGTAVGTIVPEPDALLGAGVEAPPDPIIASKQFE